MERLHVDLRITGRVQGVWYRRSAAEQATRLGVAGYAMNQADGSVRIEAEATRKGLMAFISWCRTGPPRAHVAHVEVVEGPLLGYTSFITRR